MNETETNELREALYLLVNRVPGDGESLLELMEIFLSQPIGRVHENEKEAINAARFVARFLEWDDVPEGDIA